MNKSKKILISSIAILPIIIGSSIAITSCSTVYQMPPLKPINLNNEVLNKINTKLNTTNTQLDQMTNFEDVFKIQNELLEHFKSNEFDFGSKLENCKIRIKPEFKNNKFEYYFSLELIFKIGTKLELATNDNFNIKNNILFSNFKLLNNTQLNNQNNSLTLWFNNAQSIYTSSYFNLILKQNSFDIQYNQETNNILETLAINCSILTINQINIYIENVVNVTTGNNWLNVEGSNDQTHQLQINIKYIKNKNKNLSSAETKTLNKLTINVQTEQIIQNN